MEIIPCLSLADYKNFMPVSNSSLEEKHPITILHDFVTSPLSTFKKETPKSRLKEVKYFQISLWTFWRDLH